MTQLLHGINIKEKKRNNMDFQIVTTGDSFLIGASYYSKNDVAEDDWTEFNLYLGVFRLTWRYF